MKDPILDAAIMAVFALPLMVGAIMTVYYSIVDRYRPHHSKRR